MGLRATKDEVTVEIAGQSSLKLSETYDIPIEFEGKVQVVTCFASPHSKKVLLGMNFWKENWPCASH
jgi:hypothetical protein